MKKKKMFEGLNYTILNVFKLNSKRIKASTMNGLKLLFWRTLNTLRLLRLGYCLGYCFLLLNLNKYWATRTGRCLYLLVFP